MEKILSDFSFTQQQQQDLVRYNEFVSSYFSTFSNYEDYISDRLSVYDNDSLIQSGLNQERLDIWLGQTYSGQSDLELFSNYIGAATGLSTALFKDAAEFLKPNDPQAYFLRYDHINQNFVPSSQASNYFTFKNFGKVLGALTLPITSALTAVTINDYLSEGKTEEAAKAGTKFSAGLVIGAAAMFLTPQGWAALAGAGVAAGLGWMVDKIIDEIWDDIWNKTQNNISIEDIFAAYETAPTGFIDGIIDDIPNGFDSPWLGLPGQGPDPTSPLDRPVGPWIPPAVKNPFNDGGDAPRPQTSPLVLDINMSGEIDLAAVNGSGSVYWDIDQDGFVEATGWITGGDGLLAIDLNNDGIITGHGELFGNSASHANGFLALDVYDTSNDNKITAADDRFHDFWVWIDDNVDGISQAEELYSLSDLGITSINTTYSNVNYDVNGNTIRQSSSFVMNGSTYKIVDAWFSYDSINSYYDLPYDLDIRTLFLPTMRGYGDLPDLHIAMSLDEGLLEMVQDIAGKSVLELFDPSYNLNGKIEDLIIRWAGAESVDPDSRGDHFNAQYLAALEAFIGFPFVAQGVSYATPNTNAGLFLQKAWDGLVSNVMARILFQTDGSSLLSEKASFDPFLDSFSGASVLDLDALGDLVESIAAQGQDLVWQWLNIARFVETTIGYENLSQSEIDAINAMISDSPQTANFSFESFVNRIFSNPKDSWPSVRHVYGDSDHNLMVGNTSSILDGGSGDDILVAADGLPEITLPGWQANSTYYGGAGDDTYIFAPGFGGGVDMMTRIYEYDNEGHDILWLTGGIMPENVSLYTALVSGSTGQMYISVGQYDVLSFAYKLDLSAGISTNLEKIVFDDGTVWDLTQSFIMNGSSVLDHLYGAAGNDYLNGHDGNDQIYGFEGDDVLTGGKGIDALRGGAGNDDYVFAAGDSVITVSVGDHLYEDADAGFDRIILTGGILPQDVRLYTGSNGSGLYLLYSSNNVIGISNTKNSVTNEITSHVEQIVFDNGVVWDLTQGLPLTGGTGVDTLYGSSYDDVINGREGNDQLYGWSGNDILIGGVGHDNLRGGAGDDDYVFVVGDSVTTGASGDSIYEDAGAGFDRIVLTGGILPQDVRLYTGSNGNGLYLRYSANDVINLPHTKNTVTNEITSHVEQVVFDNGVIWDLTQGFVMNGGSGTDHLYGSSYEDILYGHDGIDSLYGFGGDDVLYGGVGNDQLYGGDGSDVLYGGAGNDTLRGENGDDTLYGGIGTDTLYGGAGSDRFVFEADSAFSNVDTIADFSKAQNDVIDISDLLALYDPLNDAITDFVTITQSGSNSALFVDRDGLGTTYGLQQIATITGVTGITDVAALITGGHLDVTP